ncbi:hypothetical protein EZJ43_00475 [Pedobacter changchengzhani]|uniref:Uncharacterized protein n=1 Tax=Pedobacter changchengzhani TaxID=2529274 RepID=A0A4R5MPP6_9SPHI|nr:hypothetical protein [Pedobacter changchengzhani]TDG37606.1 hypothetical protein EZJ43_00475 [Pedobacter changchengzhani]
MKRIIFIITIISIWHFTAFSQDFIVKNNDDVIRGTIKGTDYFSVFISEDDKNDIVLPAKDVKNFFWNGDSFVSKGFPNGKDFQYRFVKAIELGAVNLYSFGGGTLIPIQKEKRVKFRPSIGIGTGGGGGGFGGSGIGGGISIGGGNRNNAPERPAGAPAIRYYIEKPGSGPIQEIQIKAVTEDDKKAGVKLLLLQKMGDKPAVKAKIEADTELNSREVTDFVKEYNENVF